MRPEPPITPDLVAGPRDQAGGIRAAPGDHRAGAHFTELGIFSAMWNEHCSYKSSKRWLRTLPTTGRR
jgi:hypothetical protein